MPDYLIIARDYADGLERRLKARRKHVDSTAGMIAEGKLMLGAAIIRSERMIGSMLVGRFADRAELDAWLAAEPYVTERVWEEWSIEEIEIGPAFADRFSGSQ